MHRRARSIIPCFHLSLLLLLLLLLRTLWRMVKQQSSREQHSTVQEKHKKSLPFSLLSFSCVSLLLCRHSHGCLVYAQNMLRRQLRMRRRRGRGRRGTRRGNSSGSTGLGARGNATNLVAADSAATTRFAPTQPVYFLVSPRKALNSDRLSPIQRVCE